MDPRENRLSASFATLLEHAPALANDLVANWFGTSQNRDLAVAVQHSIPSGWIDVELRFGDPLRPELLLWIEAKYGSGLSGAHQLAKYRLDLNDERAKRRVLLLVAPVEFDVGTLDVVRVHEAPSGDDRTHLVSWQEVYARLLHVLSG